MKTLDIQPRIRKSQATQMKHPNEILEDLLHTIIVAVSKTGKNPQILYNERTDGLSVIVEYGDDKGRCIGRKGRIFWALCMAIHQASQKLGVKTRLETMLEPLHPNHDKLPVPFRPNLNWDKKRMEDFIPKLLSGCGYKGEWKLADCGEGEADIIINISEPKDSNMEEAISTLIKAVGSSCGASVETTLNWK